MMVILIAIAKTNPNSQKSNGKYLKITFLHESSFKMDNRCCFQYLMIYTVQQRRKSCWTMVFVSISLSLLWQTKQRFEFNRKMTSKKCDTDVATTTYKSQREWTKWYFVFAHFLFVFFLTFSLGLHLAFRSTKKKEKRERTHNENIFEIRICYNSIYLFILFYSCVSMVFFFLFDGDRNS